MGKLTETLIQQRLRTCTTDLDKVQQINITGRELQDVSLLRKMTGVEILSLSVNKISSLIDFQNCKNLKELYLRHNEIEDLNEICYLQNLPKLELLMLSENPCAKDPLYRQTIIKNLKNLHQLDGRDISLEERKDAKRNGKDLLMQSDDTQRFMPDISPPPYTFTGPPKSDVTTYSKKEPEFPKCTKEDSFTSPYGPSNDYEKRGHKKSDDSFTSRKSVKKNESKMPKEEFSYCYNYEHSRPRDTQSTKVLLRSNILSATLNLVKELDYQSLLILNSEVVSSMNRYEAENFGKRNFEDMNDFDNLLT